MSPQDDPEFTIHHDTAPSETLIVGFSEFGLAGLTAVDYLVEHLALTEHGHVDVEGFPTITPFADGTPRHHTRLYAREDLDVTVLVGELFVPRWAAERLGDAVLDWTATHGVREAVVLTGVPIPHGPDDHRPFYVATPGYREARLSGTDIAPMGRGFLDGVAASLVSQAMVSELEVGVYLTPAHERVPDADAALRLLAALEATHDLGIDTGPMEQFAENVGRYYEELASRLRKADDGDRPEDRMFV